MVSYHWPDDAHAACSKSQAAGFLVATGLAIVTAAFLLVRPGGTPDDMPGPLAARINPNTATVDSLARLPGIGWTRARAIVIYRDRAASEKPGTPAFRSLADVQRIRGIGPKTAEGLAPWLRFD